MRAASAIEAKDVRSRGRCSMGASGIVLWMSAIADVAFDAVRAAR